MKTMALGTRLSAARITSPNRTSWLDGLTVLSHTVSAWLALTVTAGTWMFFQRVHNPPALMKEVINPASGGMSDDAFLYVYPALSLIACAFLVFPILGLGAGAAQLGSRGRERRLATMRLLGMSRQQTVRMSLVETISQASIGFGIGSGIYLASLPAWKLVKFQDQALGFAEMLLPWWLWPITAAALITLSIIATLLGLWQVQISPLGVSKRQTPPALKSWRIVVFVILLIAAIAVPQLVLREGSVALPLTVAAMAILAVAAAINLASPYLLQIVMRLALLSGDPVRLIAARRITGDPKSTWRAISSLTFLSFITMLAVLNMASFEVTTPGNRFDLVFRDDIVKGLLITIGFALITTTVGTSVNQASHVLDRADQIQALTRMGTPSTVLHRARRLAVTVPVAVTATISLVTAVYLSGNLGAQLSAISPLNLLLIAGIWVGCIAFAGLASAACAPLENRIITHGTGRRE